MNYSELSTREQEAVFGMDSVESMAWQCEQEELAYESSCAAHVEKFYFTELELVNPPVQNEIEYSDDIPF